MPTASSAEQSKTEKRKAMKLSPERVICERQ
jgi:hypothetical protein